MGRRERPLRDWCWQRGSGRWVRDVGRRNARRQRATDVAASERLRITEVELERGPRRDVVVERAEPDARRRRPRDAGLRGRGAGEIDLQVDAASTATEPEIEIVDGRRRRSGARLHRHARLRLRRRGDDEVGHGGGWRREHGLRRIRRAQIRPDLAALRARRAEVLDGTVAPGALGHRHDDRTKV